MKKRLSVILACGLLFGCAASQLPAQSAPTTTAASQHGSSSTTRSAEEAAANTTKAAAAHVTVQNRGPREPDLLEHLVDQILDRFDIRSNENTPTHFVIAILFLTGALLFRRLVTSLFFGTFRKIAARTKSTLDDKLLPALEAPVGTFVALIGIFAALAVLKMSEPADTAIGYGSTVAFSLVIFWGLLRALGALLDHAQEVSLKRHMGVSAFMPWIKKTLLTLFMVFGLLMVVQSLGYDVKALLTGLGIGGLAFALAAQDTLANVFGSIVVAIDQPFKIGEAIRIGASEGVVEDIGLRSTKLRTPGRNLIIIPNKIVAAEPVINNSRFVGRRVEQVIGLTYDATAEQMNAMVERIRQIIREEEEVDATSILVFFRDFNASSLDIWLGYNVRDPDFAKHMALRQRINLAIMRAVEAAKLSFAFPTQTVRLEGEIARRIADPGPPPAHRN
jgi:MscS family membrane protein